jgi:2-oxoisovalerate dehydrogenase E1 component alpha subunit
MTQRSRLHVPNAPARPGDKPDFSYVRLSPAGAVPRPDVTASVADIEDLSTSLVRVLDDNHSAIGPWNPHLETADL